MIVSYKWLQTYFKDKLPTPEKVAEVFTFGVFEVEGVEQVKGDTAIDLKVLPDRACYALSHRGVAYELAAITGQASTISFDENIVTTDHTTISDKVSVTVNDTVLCRRYCARYIKNINVGASPEWLREKLEAVGQRSINTIVDATNFVMLDMGQPLHAFDADKVKGGIVVRLAKAEEVIELLPEKGGAVGSRNIVLQDTDLVIADDVGPIAIAGVKGGMRAAVTETTKNLIIESANFDAVSVRKTSTRLNLRNDASKRFENNLSVTLAEQAMQEVSDLIKKLCDDSSVGPVTDIFSTPAKQTTISVSSDFICTRLGAVLSAGEMEEIFTRLQIGYEKSANGYKLKIPAVRLDLNIPEDVVEEVGRIYGYNKIEPAIPKKVVTENPVNQVANWIEKIKDTMYQLGFSEVQTSSFAIEGDVEIQNPMASDKKFLRTMLYQNLQKCLEQNSRNAALLGLDEVKIFEIGTVFTKDGEKVSLGLGVSVVKNIKKKDQYIADAINKAFEEISKVTGFTIKITKPLGQQDPIVGIYLSDFIPQFKPANVWDIKKLSVDIKYKPISIYPFMVRDVAVFVPSTIKEKEVSDVIDSAVGDLIVRRDLFDVFTKKFDDGTEKTSYAFHLVFQARDRTLVEDEVNSIMKKVSDALVEKSWQVR